VKKFIIMVLIILWLPVVARAQPKTMPLYRIDDSGVYWVPDGIKVKAVTLDGNFTSNYLNFRS
jgi:hypothetical protein